MKWVLDTHTHTYVSGHAYSTLMENIQYAKKRGLEVLGVTDHGPNMPGGPHIFYFGNLKVIPREIDGITILRGCEANIVDFNGNLDIPMEMQENRLDIIIASLHDVCITPGSVEENTNALLGAMDNKFVDIIGHPGNPSFPIDQELVIKKAKEKNKIIEINNSSFRSRPGCEENCLNIARLCKEYNVKVIMGSDSHFCLDIGILDKAYSLLQKADMPEELIMNTHKYKIIEYLKGKGKLRDI
ncbi:phosphatase [Clostridium sp.]|uniref:phosphatase n=1 Tax=Clostridium sp. TaxID=1506 RepID=UPI003463BCDD